MDLKSAADDNPRPLHRGFWDWPRILIYLVWPILTVAALGFPHGFGNRSPQVAREGAALALINRLSHAAKAYELDHQKYPAGDGSGTSGLKEGLQSPGAKRLSYFEFSSGMIGARGNVVNPVGEGKIIYYRCPGVHNPNSFDLWCEDTKGRADGINNWTR